MPRRHFRKHITSSEYSESVPGQLTLSSFPHHWQNLEFTEILLPDSLEDGQALPLHSNAFALLVGGTMDGECSINQGSWAYRHSKYSHAEIDFWPQNYEINWRWWPTGEMPQSLKIATVFLKQHFLEEVAAKTFDTEAKIELINKLSVKDEFIRQLIFAVKDELARGNPCGTLYAETAAQMLALHVLSKHCSVTRKFKEYKQGLPRNSLKVILNYMDEHLCNDISLGGLAGLLGLSQFHFLRMFKQSLGVTPLQYIIQLRMERAKQLLKMKQLSVTEVALEVGYESVSHFIGLFKRHTGMTPSEYQKSV